MNYTIVTFAATACWVEAMDSDVDRWKFNLPMDADGRLPTYPTDAHSWLIEGKGYLEAIQFLRCDGLEMDIPKDRVGDPSYNNRFCGA